MKMPKEGTLFNEDKTLKVEYIKIGTEYHLKVYQRITDKKSARYEPFNEQKLSMTETQFRNYLYTELYIKFI